MPWVCNFTIGWWAGILVFFPLAYVYDRLFAPEGSVCMGIPFTFALASYMALLATNVMMLVRWLGGHYR